MKSTELGEVSVAHEREHYDRLQASHDSAALGGGAGG